MRLYYYGCVVACVRTRKSGSQTRIQRKAKKCHVTFVKNPFSNSTVAAKRSSEEIYFMSSETYEHLFSILIVGCRIVVNLFFKVVVSQRAVLPFPYSRHCLLLLSWGNHERGGFLLSVLLSNCDRCITEKS